MKSIVYFLSGCIAILLLLSNSLQAQKSLIHTDPDAVFKKANELFEKEKYVAARQEFQAVVDAEENIQSIKRTDAEYYMALCAIELFHRDADYLINSFVNNHPGDPRISQLYYQMGNTQYKKKKYAKVIKYFEKVDKTELSQDQSVEFNFQLGYSYFFKQLFDSARVHFFDIKDVESEYWASANYFYGHINYSEGNYQTALNSLDQIKDDEMFSPIVPYYLTHIYYMHEDYDKIKEIAPGLLEKSTPKREPEIARIIGEAYYKTGDYKEAIPYLEKYKQLGERYEKDDIYQLGYAYYKVQKYEKAIENFEKVARGKKPLAQNAYFLLADCYLQTNNKKKAHMAFTAAANMDHDKTIEEESLFNSAKLSFELSYSPFNQTIKVFTDFLERFPNSVYKDQVYDYLTKVYMATKNYGEAIASLEKIENKNEAIKRAYQRVSFFRATELFSALRFEEAIRYYDKSLTYGSINPSYKAQAIYWKAESHYRLKIYKKAAELYNSFLLSPGAIALDEYTTAQYSLAYCYFKLENYPEAVVWFRKFVAKNEEVSKPVGDSYVRLGDCYFVQRMYVEAIKYYDLAIKINTLDTDYATFQKAFSYGLLQEQGKKNWVLREMVKEFPKSNYIVDAIFELGRSYERLDDTDQALDSYQQLTENFPKSTYAPKAFLQMGLIHYRLDHNDEAIFAYKQVVDSFPASPQAKNALLGIRNIYMDTHREDEFFQYAESVDGMAKISVNEKDSLSYLSAEKLYMQGKYEMALARFEKYIDNFPEGKYLKFVHYYKADCNLMGNNIEAAQQSFDFLISLPRNEYTEEALFHSAKINFEKENLEKALEDYQQLEAVAEAKKNMLAARIGQMRCNYQLKKVDAAIESANKVLISDKVPEETIAEAHYVLAKSYLSKHDENKAINEFKYISENVKTKEGAEAKYRVAKILFNQNKLDEAEAEILDFNKMSTPHQHWLAKSIILLSDVYVAKDDDFQARHTLESIIQYYDVPDDGIVQLAREKLDEILEREEAENLMKEMEDLELNYQDEGEPVNEKIFDEEELPAEDPIEESEQPNDSTKTEVE